MDWILWKSDQMFLLQTSQLETKLRGSHLISKPHAPELASTQEMVLFIPPGAPEPSPGPSVAPGLPFQGKGTKEKGTSLSIRKHQGSWRQVSLASQTERGEQIPGSPTEQTLVQ